MRRDTRQAIEEHVPEVDMLLKTDTSLRSFERAVIEAFTDYVRAQRIGEERAALARLGALAVVRLDDTA